MKPVCLTTLIVLVHFLGFTDYLDGASSSNEPPDGLLIPDQMKSIEPVVLKTDTKIGFLDVFDFDRILDRFKKGITNGSNAFNIEIEILFAGNTEREDGGPYWLPQGEGQQADLGYYTDLSRQNESFVEIHVEATAYNNSPITGVQLHWLEAVSPDSDPYVVGTYDFEWNGVKGYWEINTDDIVPTLQENRYYSFDVEASDYSSSKRVEWCKRGPNDKKNPTYPRRWVQLSCPVVDIFEYDASNPYHPYYLREGSYATIELDDLYAKDRYCHDSGPDGGRWDTGALQAECPSEIELRHCANFLGFWFDESVCVPEDLEIRDIYYHIWATRMHLPGGFSIGWGRTREQFALEDEGEEDRENVIDERTMAQRQLRTTYTYQKALYGLYTDHMTQLDTSEKFSDNSIYEMFLFITGGVAHPGAMSGRSTPSFVIFNLPDDLTLESLDTDGDGLNDYAELFVHYTSPFWCDTDNDDSNDDEELAADTDPNDPSDHP